MHPLRYGSLALLALLVASCATLGGLAATLQAPRFEVAEGRQAELRLLLPAPGRPLGGAAVRLWAHVENPNQVGLTLTNVDGTLFMQDQQAALVDFPLGLPLVAGQDTVIPLDVNLSFADLPGLADVLGRLVTGARVPYRLEGTMRVDAGVFGQPAFGPMRLLSGEVEVRR